MAPSKQRPVNLDLLTIRLPITAIASILHRISGLFLFISLPFLLCLLSDSLASPAKFAAVQEMTSRLLVKFGLWLVLAAAVYHTLAGLRHLLMDLGFGEELSSSQKSAAGILITSIIVSIALGVWLWA